MARVRPRRPGSRDLLAAVVAFWAITSFIFTMGRWFVPNFSLEGVSDRLGPAATESEVLEARLFDLQTAMTAPPGSFGAMDASGALTGRVTFEHLDNLQVFAVGPDGSRWQEDGSPWPCDEGDTTSNAECRYEVKIRMRDDGGTVLLISGTGLVPDGEIGSGFSMTLSAPGLTFNSKAGQCTLRFTAVEFVTGLARGWARCTGLGELRSTATLDLLVAFDIVRPAPF